MCLGWFDFKLLAKRSQDRRVDHRAICQLLGQFWCLLYPPLTFLSWQDLQHFPSSDNLPAGTRACFANLLRCFLCFACVAVSLVWFVCLFVCLVFSFFACLLAFCLLICVFVCALLFCFLLVCHLAWWSPVPIALEADDPHWSNWPLPCTAGGELADVGVYARDCGGLARRFIEIAGLARHGPRALPTQAQASQMRTLEERKDMANASDGIVFMPVHGLLIVGLSIFEIDMWQSLRMISVTAA